uniref:Uncharacterized protein n=1 Tax=Saimiri boliviensis boliviensis TaxID=39432 RepID=A0A2K6ST90_SAIBB
MAGILRLVAQRPPGRLQTVTKGVESLICTDWIRHKFTKSRIPDKIKPLRLPQGLPTEENMSNTCLKSTGELVVQWHLKPVEQKADEA